MTHKAYKVVAYTYHESERRWSAPIVLLRDTLIDAQQTRNNLKDMGYVAAVKLNSSPWLDSLNSVATKVTK